jgi:hypothetical protein
MMRLRTHHHASLCLARAMLIELVIHLLETKLWMHALGHEEEPHAHKRKPVFAFVGSHTLDNSGHECTQCRIVLPVSIELFHDDLHAFSASFPDVLEQLQRMLLRIAVSWFENFVLATLEPYYDFFI